MRKAFLVPLCTAAVVVTCMLAGCESGDATKAAATRDSVGAPLSSSITAEEAKRMIDEGDVTVVDVRSKAEYDEVHIPGALCIPLDEIGTNKLGVLPDYDATILVYCRTGVRSKLAVEKLSLIGYTDVHDIGGIRDWTDGTEDI